MSASLSCKFTCQEHWNYLERDGENICARQMLRQGRAAGAAEPPSPLPCLQMPHGMPEEGWCNPTCISSHILQQGDPSKHPKLPGEEAGTQGIHHSSLLAANSLWVSTGVTGLNRTGLALEGLLIPAPHPLQLPVRGSPKILGHYEAFQSLSEQPLSSTFKPPPAAAPSYQNLPLHAQNNPQAGANRPLRHKHIRAQVLTIWLPRCGVMECSAVADVGAHV